jgi:hypothetical protein
VTKTDAESDIHNLEGTLPLDDFQGIYSLDYIKRQYKKPVLKLIATASPKLKGKLIATEKSDPRDVNYSTIANFERL